MSAYKHAFQHHPKNIGVVFSPLTPPLPPSSTKPAAAGRASPVSPPSAGLRRGPAKRGWAEHAPRAYEVHFAWYPGVYVAHG